MEKLEINGQRRLQGTIRASGAKNSALPILFSALLSKKKIQITNVPHLADVLTAINILTQMGVEATYDFKKHTATILAKSIPNPVAPYDLVRTMRASVLVLGPLLARLGWAKVSLPGGCSIGARPVDLHLMALEKMGAKIKIEQGYIIAECKKLHGADIAFRQISVGATENTIMAAALAEGKTVLRNVAKEPEIVDLANFLNHIGAHIRGAGTDTITIVGTSALKGGKYEVISDRIEAGTYLLAGIITGGCVRVTHISKNQIQSLLNILEKMGCTIKCGKSSKHIPWVSVSSPHMDSLKPVDVVTEPFPGFPTDMQAQLMAVLALTNGISTIKESIFENRFMHVPELLRLGADISISGNSATVHGLNNDHSSLTGATVMATDLRASACLVLAALAAKGKTIIRRIYHLDRGYECMEKNLKSLGAQIRRLEDR